MSKKEVFKNGIQPQEALQIFKYATLESIWIVKELQEVYEAHTERDDDQVWDSLKLQAYIYTAGRLHGIREARARKINKSDESAKSKTKPNEIATKEEQNRLIKEKYTHSDLMKIIGQQNIFEFLKDDEISEALEDIALFNGFALNEIFQTATDFFLYGVIEGKRKERQKNKKAVNQTAK